MLPHLWVFHFFGLEKLLNDHSYEEIVKFEIANLFQITSENKLKTLYERMFLLMYYMGMEFNTLWNMPVKMQKWFLKRMDEEISRASEAKQDIPHKGADANTPQNRELTGKFRSFNPNPRTQRFT